MSAGRKRFTHRHRLKTQGEYQRVFEAPVKSSNGCMTLLARDNCGGQARLGLAISRKNVRRAVDRNRIKRVIRESFRQHLEQLVGLDIVALGRSGIAARDNEELRAALGVHWSKLARCKRS